MKEQDVYDVIDVDKCNCMLVVSGYCQGTT
jgi:hypothetical protein